MMKDTLRHSRKITSMEIVAIDAIASSTFDTFPFDSLFESKSTFEAPKAFAHMHMHKPQLKPRDQESDKEAW